MPAAAIFIFMIRRSARIARKVVYQLSLTAISGFMILTFQETVPGAVVELIAAGSPASGSTAPISVKMKPQKWAVGFIAAGAPA